MPPVTIITSQPRIKCMIIKELLENEGSTRAPIGRVSEILIVPTPKPSADQPDSFNVMVIGRTLDHNDIEYVRTLAEGILLTLRHVEGGQRIALTFPPSPNDSTLTKACRQFKQKVEAAAAYVKGGQ